MIGCGNFARRQHLPNLGRVEGARLRWACDRDEARAARCREDFGAERATGRAEDVLADAEVDAVIVCVRDELQPELVAAALRAGKHVYVEKPAASSAAQFRELIAARDRANVNVAVGFNKRFAPVYRAARAVFGGGERLHSAYARMADDAWRWATGYALGAQLRHDACHLFDLLRWLGSDEVVAVVAAQSRPDEDSVLLRFQGGGTALVFNSGHATMDLPKERVELFGQRGSLVADDFVELRAFGFPGIAPRQSFRGASAGGALAELKALELLGDRGLDGMIAVRREVARQRADDAGGPLADVLPNFLRDQGWLAALAEFIRAVQDGRRAGNATLEDAWRAAAIVDAAEASRRDGGVVPIAGADAAAGSGRFLRRGGEPAPGAVAVTLPRELAAAQASVCGLKEFLIDERRTFRRADGRELMLDCAKVALLDITDSPVHVHAHTVEIYHVLEGEGEMVLGREVLPVGAGSLILIPPGTPHGLHGREPGRSLRVLISFTPGMASVDHWEFRDETILHPSTAARARELSP